MWVANRRNPINSTTGVLSITANGSLVVTDGNSIVIWLFSSTTPQVANPIAKLLDTGNFIVAEYNDLNNIVWQGFDYPTDTLIPGMKIGWDRKSGLNCNLTGWLTSADPSPGKYTFAVDLHGVPQLTFWAGSVRQWRSTPWIPYNDPTSNATFSFFFVVNEEEVSFTVDVINKSTLTRLVVNPSGNTQRLMLLDSGQWGQYWSVQDTRCDLFGVCGPNSVCYRDTSTMCSCLPGFEPKLPQLWASMDYFGGCIRKTVLDCRNGSDGFMTMQRTGVPDTMRATVDMRLSLDDCRAKCLGNCSCAGFSSANIHGSGCITWSTDLLGVVMFVTGGHEFHLRLAAADIGSILRQSHNSRDRTLAVVLSVILGTLLLAGAVCCIWKKQKPSRGNNFVQDESIVESSREGEREMTLFDFEVIDTATDNFSDENKLGEGGFGLVYKGKTKDGQEIAVKRLSRSSVQGLVDLKTEVRLIAKLQHRNVVRLLGCCIQGDERILVYEYMPNKSLDGFLFDEKKVMPLDWGRRYHIILGIARGLLYLHQDSRFRIIHRDLKTSNILLDKDMNPKISDFGVARAFGGDETEIRTGRIVGTYGYMAPEYALDGIFSVKSDVFSFGVLILEIISGRRNEGVYFSEADNFLLDQAWTLWEEGNGLRLVNDSLESSFSESEVLSCMKVGLLCIQERPDDRPTMSSVVLMLGSDFTFLPEPKPPGCRKKAFSLNEHSSSSTVNDVTITISAKEVKL